MNPDPLENWPAERCTADAWGPEETLTPEHWDQRLASQRRATQDRNRFQVAVDVARREAREPMYWPHRYWLLYRGGHYELLDTNVPTVRRQLTDLVGSLLFKLGQSSGHVRFPQGHKVGRSGPTRVSSTLRPATDDEVVAYLEASRRG